MAYGSGEPADYRNYYHYVSPEAEWHDATVWFFGDSIGNGGKATLKTQVEATGNTIVFDTWSCRPTAPAVDALESRLASAVFRKPSLVLMECGTNNIYDPPAMLAQVQRTVDLCEAHGVELIWIDTFAMRPGFELADLMNCAWVNEAIHQNVPASRIIRWHRWFASNKGRIAARLADGVHPKPTEYGFWSAAVMAVLGPLL